MFQQEHSVAHKGDSSAARFYPGGEVPWRPETPPDMASGRTTGSLRGCGCCGSMHPADLAAAIRAGAIGSWAVRKYGWPPKAYFDNIPNPHAGMLESRRSHSSPPQDEIDAGKWVQVPDGFSPRTGEREWRWAAAGEPAAPITRGKFYTVHLLDASDEDRKTIEEHLGLRFKFFDDGTVSWEPVKANTEVDE